MSPERSNRSSPSSNPKPYSKASSPEKQAQSSEIARSKPAKPDQAGFPPYAHYLQIEEKYLASLSATRRSKALITQEMFDRIWDILHNPHHVTENATFKFWVRKKFSLGTVSQPPGDPDATSFEYESQSQAQTPAKPQVVLLHDGNLVAVQDQIYEILCFSHGLSDHAGRDRTVAVLKRHYTWIPKELVAQFIKACPTCIGKKCGLSTIQRKAKEPEENHVKPVMLKNKKRKHTIGPLMGDHLSTAPALRRTQSEGTSSWNSATIAFVDTGSGSSSGSSSGASHSALDANTNIHLDTEAGQPNIETDMDRNEAQSAPSRLELTSGYQLNSDLRSLPMSREVSLFQGIPNGWQFHHADYAEAHDAFLKMKGREGEDKKLGVPRPTRGHGSGSAMLARSAVPQPRIPSLAPMVRTLDEDYDGEEVDELDEETTLDDWVFPPPIPKRSSIEPRQEFQIDPALLSLSQVLAAAPSHPAASPAIMESNFPGPAVASSIHRAAPPPAIDLGSLSSQVAIQTFLRLRESAVESPGTPFGDVSPGSSTGSEYSRGSGVAAGVLSPFEVLMSATSSASTAGTGMVVTPRDDDRVSPDIGKRIPEKEGDREEVKELLELAAEMIRLGEVKGGSVPGMVRA
ncbi:Nucleolar protein 4 [Hypsizygus marmoreus]|uniref:Nucleolar protein 4 n=1 Tax=Hypsizygus marmoreus TaxID=39966 RepID=A0A369JAV1_HYPMA|nr:Nucleolar protein 4 [Hypsizygus marmoreus]